MKWFPILALATLIHFASTANFMMRSRMHRYQTWRQFFLTMIACPLKQEDFDRLMTIEKIKQSPDCEGCSSRQWNDALGLVCGISTRWANRCFYEKQNCLYRGQGILKEK